MKIYCEKCGSTQFLRHLEDCEAWKVAVEKPTLARQEAVARANKSSLSADDVPTWR
jgi:hypothetical protein